MLRLVIAALAVMTCACDSSPASSYPNESADGVAVELTGRVVDDADILSSDTETELSNQSAALENHTSDQLVVVTLNSLQSRSIEEVGLKLGRRWGIGRDDLDNGVLLIVAPIERKARIEVGYGLEALLTDEKSAEIIGNVLPEFRRGDFDSGVKVGVGQIVGVLQSDRQRPQYRIARKKAA